MTFTATEPVSDAPNDAALDAETVTEPAATSALMVEELLPFTQTWPLEKTFDPSSIDASAVLAIWFTATEPPIVAARLRLWLAATATEPTRAVVLIEPVNFASTRTLPTRETSVPRSESSMTALTVLVILFSATEAAAERLPPPEPPAPTVSATAPASAVMSELSVDVTLTSPAVVIVLELIRASVRLWIAFSEIEPAPAIDRLNDPDPAPTEPAMPKVRTSITDVFEALTATDPTLI